MTDEATIISYQFRVWRQEIDSGFDAYENALAVRRYYNRHGYTEHFRELIGTEGIITAAGEAIAKFIAWVRKKISEIIQKIRQFFHNLKVRIFKFLGIRSGGSTNDAKDVAATLNQMNVVRDTDKRPPAVMNQGIGTNKEESGIKLPGGCRLEGQEYYIHWNLPDIQSYSNALRAFGTYYDPEITFETYDNTLDLYKKMVAESGDDEEHAITRSDMQTCCKTIATNAAATTVNCDTLTINMDRYSKEIDQYLKDAEHQDEHNEDLKRAVNTLIHGAELHENFYINDNLTGSLIEKHKHILQISTRLIESRSKLAYYTSKFISVMDRIYNAGVKAVHVILPIDRSFAKDLQEFITKAYNLGSSQFNPRNVIVTNTSPMTWDVDGDVSNGNMGWGTGGTGTSGSKDIYINYRAYKAVFENPRITDIKISETLLNTIIHEATHMFDYQNDQVIDNTVTYWFRPHEMRARQIANTFVVTKEHTKWISDVVHKVQKLTGVR